MGEIFKYEMWCKKTKIKDTNPKKSIEINWEMAELLRVTTKKSYNIEEETIEKQYGVPLKTKKTPIKGRRNLRKIIRWNRP